MADNPYDLSGLYGDTPAAPPPASAPKKKSDPYDLSGLYGDSKTPAPKPQAPPMQAVPESVGSKILNAPGVGPTLNFLNDYAVQPFETLASAGADIGKFLATAPAKVDNAVFDAVNPGVRDSERQAFPKLAKVADTTHGILSGVGEVAGSVIADPRNWPFLGSAAIKNVLLKRATQLGFTGLMSKGAIDQANQIGAEWDSATPEQRAEQLTKLGINVVGAVGAGGELGKPGEAPRLPVQGSPRLNFLQPMIDNAPREGSPSLLNAEAAESAVQPKLDAARAERQVAAAEQAKANLQRPALPIDETPSPVTPPKGEPSLYDLDGLYNEPKQAPSPRVGEEVPGLDQQAEEIAKNAPQGDLSLRGEQAAKTPEVVPGEQGAPVAQESTPSRAWIPVRDGVFESSDGSIRKSSFTGQDGQTMWRYARRDHVGDIMGSPNELSPEDANAKILADAEKHNVHPKYEQIGIDADSGQPILKQKTERRLDTSERKRVSEMSPEEMQKELLTSESLNLPNKRAFLEEEARNPSPAISMSDADGLKAFNDKFGYEYGNKLLEAKAEALKGAGLDAYHEKGDEFLQRDGSPEDLQNKLEHARELLRNKEIEVELNDGTIKKYKGVDFSYGVGKDLSEAEANLKQHKATREAAGERARGELRGITEAGSQADQVSQGSQLEASPAGAEASQLQGSVRRGVPPAGEVGTMPTADISVNPHRFQFKLNTDAEGVGTLLKEAPHYNDELAGTISVWTDPADGKTYVINGHHRLELAKRTGQREVAVRHIRAKDAAEARSVGALQNIAEGRGTPVDAAKFFRESGMTAEDVKASGVSLGEATARRGLALSRLDDSLFNRVVQGDLREGRAAAIGEATADHAEQKAIADLVDARERKGKTVTDETLKELIRFVKGTGQSVESTMSLFGEQHIAKSYALEKAEISAYIKGQLAKDRKLFGFVSDAGRAERLRAEKAGTVKTGKAAKISEQAAQAEEVYNRLSDRSGPVADILEKSAREIAEGGKADAIKSKAYGDIRTEISKALSGSEAGASAKSEAGSGQGTAAPQKRGVSESRSASLGAPPDKAQFRNPNPSPNLIGFIEDAGKKLKIEPYHEQLSLDGEPDPQVVLKDGKSYRIVTEKRLREVLSYNPELLNIHPSPALEKYKAEFVTPEAEPRDLKLEMQDAPPEKMPTLFGPGDLGEIIGSTEKPKRLISKETYDDARQNFLDKVTRSSAGVDVSAVKDLAVIGAYHFESGIRTFAEWSKKMVSELGEAVRPHLTKIWNDIQERVANGEALPSAKIQAPAAKLNFLNQSEEVKKPQPKAQAAPPQTPNFLKPKTASSAPEPERAGNINLSKFNVTDAAKELIKAADVTGEGFEEQRRGVQSHEKTQALAGKLGLTSDELAKTRKGSAFNAEELHAAGNLLASSAENMRKLQDKAAKTGSVNDQIAVLEAYAKHVSVQQAVSGATAEAGRALNALKIIRQAQDVAGKDNRTKVLDALRENLGEDWVNRAEAITKKVSQFPEGDTVGLNKFLRESVKVPIGQMLNNYFLANLLSGPKTPIKKGLGDLALAALQHPQRVLEGAIDLGRSKVTGKPQEHFIREALPAATAYFSAFPKALQKFAHIMRNGFTPEQAAVLEAPGINELPGGLKNPLNYSTRWLSATAEMYKAMALEGELNAQAVRQALKEGANGQALDKRIKQLVAERPPELIDKAIKQAKLETYTTDADGMVRLAKSVQQIYTVPEDFAIKPLRGFQPGRVIIPFAKVPWNIAKIGIEYGTPARGLSFLTKEGRSAQNFAPNAAKAIIGSSIFAIGYGLAQQGNLTGPVPKDPKEKEKFLGEGKQPYSFKVGDKWISYHVLPPLAIGWAAAAAMHDNNQDPAIERIVETGAAVAKSIVDASFFAGLNNAMEAINGYQAGGGGAAGIGQGAKSLAGNVASGFVPLSSLLRQITHAKDSTVRDADTIYERVKANLPILSEDLPAKLDRFGRPIQRLGDTGVAAFLPIQPAESGPLSKVDEEVDRLGIKVTEPGKQLSVGNQKYDLSKDQQRDLRKITGQQIDSALSELFASGRYKDLSDEKKQLITQRVMDAVRERAHVEFIKKIKGENIPLTKHVRPNFLSQEAR